ncbi:MAG: glycosyltransferase [Fervidobacterium sp.]|uniref:glycosyltransferase n=1 Tax=Fervidobacterium sp. TaxID=1871331 RepID=UPI004049F333
MIYISDLADFKIDLGVAKKIISQAKAFSRITRGDVLVVARHGNRVLVERVKDSQVVDSHDLFSIGDSTGLKGKIYSFVLYHARLARKIDSVANKDNGPLIAYIRSSRYNPDAAKLVKKLKNKGYKIILEIPTANVVEELRKMNSAVKWILIGEYKMYAKRIYELVDLIISIGTNNDALERFRKKTIVITNGIDLTTLPLVTPPPLETTLNLVGVGNISYWHGYDRLIRGLAEYYASPKNFEVNFHVIGDGSELSTLRTLVEKLKLDYHVFFHGRKSGRELYEVYQKCHVGIGSLGNHRKEMFTTSELKLREYCACGLPFVYATFDPDFDEQFPFAHKVPANEEPINVLEIIRFYERIRKEYPDYPKRMREYAEEKLTWDIKLRPVIERIQRSISTNGK